MSFLISISYLAGIGALIDSYRRPYSAWEHADRDRGHWAVVGVFMTLFAVGLFYAVLYLVLVVPRFGSESETRGDFRRESSPG